MATITETAREAATANLATRDVPAPVAEKVAQEIARIVAAASWHMLTGLVDLPAERRGVAADIRLVLDGPTPATPVIAAAVRAAASAIVNGGK